MTSLSSKSRVLLFLTLAGVALVVGCAAPSPTELPLQSPLQSPLVEPTASKAFAAAGTLKRLDGTPLRFVTVFAAQVSSVADDFSVASVDLSSPSTRTDGEGNFTFAKLPPGRYVLAVDPIPAQFILLKDAQGKPIAFEVKQEGGVSIGVVNVDYPFEDGVSQ